MESINVNSLKKGMVIQLDGTLWSVQDTQWVKPGKGPAYLQLKLRNVRTGTGVEKRLRTADKVDVAHKETRMVQYLYTDGTDYHFMYQDTFEQVGLSGTVLSDATSYLVENLEVGLFLVEGEPMGVELPPTVVMKITYTEPGLRGDTASGATKPATTETGLVLQVPLFIDNEELVRVDTRDGEYLERA